MLYILYAFALAAILIGAGQVLRRPLQKSTRLTRVVCPVCATVPPRIHRNRIMHILSAIVPLRMYGCRTCKRTFVRVKKLREQVGAAH